MKGWTSAKRDLIGLFTFGRIDLIYISHRNWKHISLQWYIYMYMHFTFHTMSQSRI